MGLPRWALTALCVSTTASGLIVPTISRYPGNGGILVVAGRVQIETIGTGANAAQKLTYQLLGIDPGCGSANVPNISNACGIHIHQAATCGLASDIQGHYWNSALLGNNDPWTSVTYSTSQGGGSNGVCTVTTGLTEDQVVGNAVVIHDERGVRIGCGLIMREVAPDDDMIVPSLGRFPGYSGPYLVTGNAQISTTLKFEMGVRGVGQQTITFSFNGGDDRCGTLNTAGVANACGVHIHEGASCGSPSFVADHVWNTTILGSGRIARDPWEFVQYTAPNGKGQGTVTVITGLAARTIDGAVLVIHDVTGVAISCGIITRRDDWTWMDGGGPVDVPMQEPETYIGASARTGPAAWFGLLLLAFGTRGLPGLSASAFAS